MEKASKKKIIDQALLVGSLVFIALTLGYDGYNYWNLMKEKTALETDVDSFQRALSVSQQNLFKLQNENSTISANLETERQNTVYIQNQIQDITSTVGQLKKLSETDVELLKKYSKIYFLNENYIPPRLLDISEQYLNIKTKQVQIHSDVWPHMKALLDTAQSQGVTIQILSGYRSFSTQAGLKSTYKVTYGSGANKFSADQGYSEHQLGTTVDFTTQKIGSVLTGFEKTDAYTWLIANAYKYGFILSYPKNNAYYIYEPWHWRFVGVALATRLHEQNQYFYDVAQRDIDQYLANIFD